MHIHSDHILLGIISEETTVRWYGNRSLDPNTANLSARDFYDYYNRPSEVNASIKDADIPAMFKGLVKGKKGPKLFIEIYIDYNAVRTYLFTFNVNTQLIPSLSK